MSRGSRYDNLITGVTAKLPAPGDAVAAPRQRHKFRAAPERRDGHFFASRAEAKRYSELMLLWEADVIRAMRLQPRYQLLPKTDIGGEHLSSIEYVADFAYYEVATRKQVVEDVKGVETSMFRLKRNWFLRLYGNLELRVLKKRSPDG